MQLTSIDEKKITWSWLKKCSLNITVNELYYSNNLSIVYLECE